MQKLNVYKTADNVLFENVSDAMRHLDAKYADLLTKLAHQLVALDKYTKICEFLDNNLSCFVELNKIKEDMKLIKVDDNEDDEE